jgi:hypothetical protein
LGVEVGQIANADATSGWSGPEGRYAEAEPLLKRAVATDEKAFGTTKTPGRKRTRPRIRPTIFAK